MLEMFGVVAPVEVDGSAWRTAGVFTFWFVGVIFVSVGIIAFVGEWLERREEKRRRRVTERLLKKFREEQPLKGVSPEALRRSLDKLCAMGLIWKDGSGYYRLCEGVKENLYLMGKFDEPTISMAVLAKVAETPQWRP